MLTADGSFLGALGILIKGADAEGGLVGNTVRGGPRTVGEGVGEGDANNLNGAEVAGAAVTWPVSA